MRFCGCGASIEVFGRSIRDLWLACGALAKIVGGMYVGEPEGVTKMRSACRVRFGEALHQTPITPLPAKPADSTPQAAPSTERPVSSTDQAAPSTDPPA